MSGRLNLGQSEPSPLEIDCEIVVRGCEKPEVVEVINKVMETMILALKECKTYEDWCFAGQVVSVLGGSVAGDCKAQATEAMRGIMEILQGKLNEQLASVFGHSPEKASFADKVRGAERLATSMNCVMEESIKAANPDLGVNGVCDKRAEEMRVIFDSVKSPPTPGHMVKMALLGVLERSAEILRGAKE